MLSLYLACFGFGGVLLLVSMLFGVLSAVSSSSSGGMDGSGLHEQPESQAAAARLASMRRDKADSGPDP